MDIIALARDLAAQDPVEAAAGAGLRYVSDDRPGITRRRRGQGWSYHRADGSLVTDPEERRRIDALAIPPAWAEVWICPQRDGHIQATGRDAKGRKQYRYHAVWQRVRNEAKFTRMVAFAHALPTIRERVNDYLAQPGLSREKVLATVVSLLELTCIRVGNEEYVWQNRSYGLTTLRNRHVDVDGSRLRFRFRGKSGVQHDVELRDRRLARIVRRCQELPGQELFEYEDESGEPRSVGSEDVNQFLREVSGENFTAKDFRTWLGTVRAATAFRELGRCDSETDCKSNVVAVCGAVAEQLGNRPATCRKYYIHPAVVAAYQEGWLIEVLDRHLAQGGEQPPWGLAPEESAVLEVLERHAETALQQAA